MESAKIILACVLAAVAYGIAHDQVTARVCIEYFTIGHPPVFPTDSPTLLALGWGVIATWWVGLLLGIPTALACRLGSRPKLAVRQLFRPIVRLLTAMALASLVCGVIGMLVAMNGDVWLLEPMRSRVPAEKHAAFLSDLWAHSAAYAVGFFGGLINCVWLFRQRGRLALAA